MKVILPAVFMVANFVQAQETDSVSKRAVTKNANDKITILLYERMIWDNQGNMRFDENVVSNFALNSWLRSEAGIRFGHAPQRIDSYIHYKLELQTKFFFQTVRLFVRLSNDINRSSSYARSYYLAAAEVRRPLSRSFSFLAAGGLAMAIHRDSSSDAAPSLAGAQTSYLIYKLGLRYKLNSMGFVETTLGNYDVFNPYNPSYSFLQTHFEYNLSRRVSFTSNLRYQFSTSIDKPMSYFIIAGVKLHFDR